MNKKLMNGVIFAMPLPDGKFLPGKVMLDIAGNIKRRLFSWDSPLGNFFSGTVLVEIYSVPSSKPEYIPSPILIPGRLVAPKEIGKGWPILGKTPVDPCMVEFPESLIEIVNEPKGEVGFRCGEISLPLPITREEYKGIAVRGSFEFAERLPHACEIMLGISKKFNVTPQEELSRNDLRFSKHRVRVYEHLPFPMQTSYFEKQKMMGLHLERLYE